MRIWIKVIFALILIKLSQEECDKRSEYSSRFIGYDFDRTYKTHIFCKDLTPSYDLRGYILSKIEPTALEDIIITNSSIPEICEDTFHNISVKLLRIEADVEIVQSSAFEDCDISSIILDFNDIKEIKDRSFSSSMIQNLGLKNNGLSEIRANNFLGLTNLKKMDLSQNRIVTIEKRSFDDLTNLNELDLSFNNVVELHVELFRNQTHLEKIYLNNNDLVDLIEGTFSECTSLKYLNIGNNYLTRISDARYLPNSLIQINVSNNALTFAVFSSLDKVTTIDVSFNNLTSNGWFYNLTSVKYLYFNHNSLGPNASAIELSSWTNLTEIQLESNGLKNFDTRSLSNSTHLTGLSLAINDLTQLDFSQCAVHLMKLDLSRNSLTKIENLSRFQELVKLNLSSNDLQEIKYDTFENMKSLLELHLQYNAIHTIHMGCLKNLDSLQLLDLSHNKITIIDIGAFTGADQLLTLNLSYNYLLHLDQNIFHNLGRLVNLNLAYNNLNSVEINEVLYHLNSLKEVNLIGNNWTCGLLVDVSEIHPGLKLTRGTSYDVSNIFGIPCYNSKVEKDQKAEDKSAVYLNSIEEHEKDISYKTSINNFFISVVLILIFLILTYEKWVHCFAITKRFVHKRHRNEQEIQLL